MADPVRSIECLIVELPRSTPYLGPLAQGERVNARGYVVRRGNGVIYPTTDRSVLVRVETQSGLIGWGETYGLCAPRAVCEIIQDLLAPNVIERDPLDAAAIWDDLYDQMRVRGVFGGFYLDAMAALDIALWDLAGKTCRQPLYRLLGGKRREIVPAYVSGLPAASIAERTALARQWVERGFDAIKFAAVVSHEGVVEEMSALREALGPKPRLMVDLHWKFSPAEAIKLIRQLERFDLTFAEAPVRPEDIDGLASVARSVATPIAAGEEWHTTFVARPRLEARAVAIVQPEMAHTGVTQFTRIAQLTQAFHRQLAPHATIGVGVFLAASLHASATVKDLLWHEYQHSIFDHAGRWLDSPLQCDASGYRVPEGFGLGVQPSAALLARAVRYET